MFKPDLSPQKSRIFFHFVLDPVLKAQDFFFFSASSPRQKKVKEIAYKMTSYQGPFKSASFFSFIIVINARQIKLNNEIVLNSLLSN